MGNLFEVLRNLFQFSGGLILSSWGIRNKSMGDLFQDSEELVLGPKGTCLDNPRKLVSSPKRTCSKSSRDLFQVLGSLDLIS
jgi:hypothetical protein